MPDLQGHRQGEVLGVPGKKAMPYATAKENRGYEHVKASELKLGRPLKEAKSIAAATENKLRSRRGETKTVRGRKV